MPKDGSAASNACENSVGYGSDNHIEAFSNEAKSSNHSNVHSNFAENHSMVEDEMYAKQSDSEVSKSDILP